MIWAIEYYQVNCYPVLIKQLKVIHTSIRPGSDVISGVVADDVMPLVGVAAVAASVGACTKQLELVDHSGRTTRVARSRATISPTLTSQRMPVSSHLFLEYHVT